MTLKGKLKIVYFSCMFGYTGIFSYFTYLLVWNFSRNIICYEGPCLSLLLPLMVSIGVMEVMVYYTLAIWDANKNIGEFK